MLTALSSLRQSSSSKVRRAERRAGRDCPRGRHLRVGRLVDVRMLPTRALAEGALDVLRAAPLAHTQRRVQRAAAAAAAAALRTQHDNAATRTPAPPARAIHHHPCRHPAVHYIKGEPVAAHSLGRRSVERRETPRQPSASAPFLRLRMEKGRQLCSGAALRCSAGGAPQPGWACGQPASCTPPGGSRAWEKGYRALAGGMVEVPTDRCHA